jgi:DNA-binding XRE family transcriptional regulator
LMRQIPKEGGPGRGKTNSPGEILPSSCQIVAARSLLQMGQRRLAEITGVSLATVVRIESSGWRTPCGHATTVERVVVALQDAGVEFLPLGVQLSRKPPHSRK